MYQNRLENIVQIIEVQNTKLLENTKRKLPEPKIIEYEETDYEFEEEKKKMTLSFNGLSHLFYLL